MVSRIIILIKGVIGKLYNSFEELAFENEGLECYLIAQNGDPRKEQIAFAQTYFAIQTRKAELIEQRLQEIERVEARKKLQDTEKRLSGVL